MATNIYKQLATNFGYHQCNCYSNHCNKLERYTGLWFKLTPSNKAELKFYRGTDLPIDLKRLHLFAFPNLVNVYTEIFKPNNIRYNSPNYDLALFLPSTFRQ